MGMFRCVRARRQWQCLETTMFRNARPHRQERQAWLDLGCCVHVVFAHPPQRLCCNFIMWWQAEGSARGLQPQPAQCGSSHL